MVADAKPVVGGALGGLVESRCGGGDLVLVEPALQRDERVDEDIEPQGLCRLEDVLLRGSRCHDVAATTLVGQEHGMPRFRREAVPGEGLRELWGPRDEVEGLDVAQTHAGQPSQSAVEVLGQLIVHGIDLYGEHGLGHRSNAFRSPSVR